MGVQIKICGLNDRAGAEAALRAGADFAGLVFFSRSPRHLTPEVARTLGLVLKSRARLVGLFVDPKDDEISAALAAAPLDLIQLHGSESPERVGAIAARFGLPIIKVIAIAESADAARAGAYEEMAEYLMFDARAPVEATRPGGHGAAFDWKILAGAKFRRPWFLAGGLDPENVARAIQISGAQFVDVSSGVENAPGRKSPEKILAFASAARGSPANPVQRGAA